MCIADEIEAVYSLTEELKDKWLLSGIPADRRESMAFELLCDALISLSSAAVNLGRYGVIRGRQAKPSDKPTNTYIEYSILSE